MHYVIRMTYLALVSHPDELRQIHYVIRMTYSSILCHPDDLTEVGFSSGWVTAMLLCHPDEIANFHFPQQAVALQRFRNRPPLVHLLCRSGNDPRIIWLLWSNNFVWRDGKQLYVTYWWLNTLRPRQSGRHFPDGIFKCIFLNENAWISLKISLKFVPKVRFNNILALVQIMTWCRPVDNPLSGPMMANLLTHICVTEPQRVNDKNA